MLPLKTKQSELIMHHVTNTMRKAIIKRWTGLQHRYFKTRTSKNLKLFPNSKEISVYSRLYKREKRNTLIILI